MPKFVPRERKHRRLAKLKQSPKLVTDENVEDANAEIILPGDRVISSQDRRAELTRQVREQQPKDAKISAKKKKRLDKYVDQKLRKEENLVLLKKLAAQKIDTSLLRSSKKLGRVNETKREKLIRARREEQAGIDVDGNRDEILFQPRQSVSLDDQSSSSDEEEQDDINLVNDGESTLQEQEVGTVVAKTQPTFGVGLKRPVEAADGFNLPTIVKRKRRKLEPPKVIEAIPIARPTFASDSEDAASSVSSPQEDEWEGFSDAEKQSGGKDSSGESGGEDESDGPVSVDEDSDEEYESANETITPEDSKQRVSAFKAWADSQRNAAVGFTPSTIITSDESMRAQFVPRQPSPDPISATLLETGKISTARPAAAITIERSEDIQKARFELPVVQEEQKIMEAINTNPVVVVCGATGSGKTTQVPQMLFENGYGSYIGRAGNSPEKGLQSKGMIGVTQPRRVAATSVANRVADELGPHYRARVGHQVRYDTNISRDTAIKFMTDGILLREISQDFILSKYSAIVIDEAHERSVNTDILIGMLSRITALRSELTLEDPSKHYPLKLTIMSATLRVADFAQNTRLFRDTSPPIIQAEGRQYTVTEHFSRRTHRDYVSEMTKKVTRGHKKLPPGTILVFLTSQNDIQTVARSLKASLGGNTVIALHDKQESNSRQLPLEADDYESFDRVGKEENDYIEDASSDDGSEPEIHGLDPDDADEEFNVEPNDTQQGSKAPLKPHILPLYAALPANQQMKVFQPPPEGSRLIVLATNVAETSLTIPGVRYVFDCGRAKEKKYDPVHGVQTFEIDWISKASASQRAGRAGRTGPGHVYRLYSSAVYEQFFAEHSIPEILRTPLESTVLQLKSMEIENIVNFPFPTSPDSTHLIQAERLLSSIGAIGERDGKITSVGREIMVYPVNPRYGKILLLAQRNQILDIAIATVAALAVGELFIPQVQMSGDSQVDAGASSDDSDDERKRRQDKRLEKEAQTVAQEKQNAYSRAQATLARWDDQSDVIKLLTAVAAYAEASQKDNTMGAASKFCQDFFLREKGMLEVQHLRHQLHNIVASRHPAQMKPFRPTLSLPTEKDRKMLNQVVASGFLDQVAIRSDALKDQSLGFGRNPRRATEVAYRTLVPSSDLDKTLDLQSQEIQRSVFVHPSSVLAHFSAKEMPTYIIYSHLSRAPVSRVGQSDKVLRTRMHPLCTLGPKQLAGLAEGTPMLELGAPIGKIEEVSSVQRQCWVGVSLKAPIAGGNSWPLSAWKVLQRRKGGSWEVEKVVAR